MWRPPGGAGCGRSVCARADFPTRCFAAQGPSRCMTMWRLCSAITMGRRWQGEASAPAPAAHLREVRCNELVADVVAVADVGNGDRFRAFVSCRLGFLDA